MLLAFDVGNTNIVVGIFDDYGELRTSWRLKTDTGKSADEYGMVFDQLFNYEGFSYEDINDVSLDALEEDGVNLLFNALLLNEVLEDAFSSRQMQKVTDYLKFLSSLFHKFYNEHKVVGSENEDIYLKLFAVVKRSIHKGLELIGIEAKEVM